MSVEELRNLLESVPSGPVHVDLKNEVVNCLAQCWSSLSESSDTSMSERKITTARVENLIWEPPVLSFVIERHGGTVQGSKSGELQGWLVNLDLNNASWRPAGMRRLKKFAPKLDVQALAVEVFHLIQRRKSDDRLTWTGDTCVRVNMTIVIPNGSAQQTTQGRRKRFRTILKALMLAAGWRDIPSGTQLVFERVAET